MTRQTCSVKVRSKLRPTAIQVLKPQIATAATSITNTPKSVTGEVAYVTN